MNVSKTQTWPCLAGVYSAREFVGWYNGDPACADLSPPLKAALEGETAVVFGLGNVAVDCARVWPGIGNSQFGQMTVLRGIISGKMTILAMLILAEILCHMARFGQVTILSGLGLGEMTILAGAAEEAGAPGGYRHMQARAGRFESEQGMAVQVDPIKPTLEAPATKC